MSWTKFKMYLALVCVVVIFSYIPAVIVDVYLTGSHYMVTKTYEYLRSIEEQRKILDYKYRDVALKDGFSPLFYPNLIRNADGDFAKIAKKFDVAPLAPQPKESLYYCNEGYGLVSYKSDRYGFRNSDDVWDQGNKTFLIGDSFVHGACIPDENKTITGYLKDSTNSINLGTGSNGPIHYAAITKTFVKNFAPENVVMVFYPNDNEDAEIDNIESYYYDYYWKEDKEPYLLRRGSEYVLNPKLIAFYNAIKNPLKSGISFSEADSNVSSLPQVENALTADQVHDFVVKDSSVFEILSWKNFRLSFLRKQINSLIKNSNSGLTFSSKLAIDELEDLCFESCNAYIVYIPNSLLWRPDSRADRYRRNLEKYALSKNVTFIDTTKRLRQLSESEIYAVKGPHLSPKGYHLVAEMISTAIRK